MKLLSGISVRRGEKPIPIGSWGGISRKRKGVQFGYEWLSPSSNSINVNQYQNPFRFLSNDQCWDAYRRCADLRAAVDSIVRRVATFDWIVSPVIDPHDNRYNSLLEVCEKVRGFLLRPNKNGDTWQEVMTSFLTDTLVYDSGVLELVHDK